MKNKNKNIIALVPARKNSKGIRNKNIINFLGKPLITYSINICHKIKLINEVFVSTDSVKIKKISLKNKASCPFIRPAKYSGDKSSDLEVFKHFYRFYRKNFKKKIDLIVHLRPTTPLRSPSLLKKLIRLMINNPKFSSLRCFKKVSNSPYKMWKRVGSVAKPFINSKKELHSTARQTHPVVYKHVGYVDIIRPERTILKNSMVGDKVYFYYINPNKYYTNDIDTKKDLKTERKFIEKFSNYNY